MKENIHPEYKEVVFYDVEANFKYLTRSTIKTSETIQHDDGKTYPVVKVDISSESHPFYTGKHKLIDAAGRVDKFKKKYNIT